MSDPLSITASLIAIGTLTVQVSQLVKHVLHASDEVLGLEAELEDVKAVTKQLEILTQDQWPSEHEATIDTAKLILEGVIDKRLRNIQGHLATHFRGSRLRLNHVAWALLRGKINVELLALRAGKKRLFEIFSLLNSSTTRHLGFQATAISIGIEHINTSQDRHFQDIVARLKPLEGLQSSSGQVSEIFQLMQRVQAGVNELNTKLAQSGDHAPGSLGYGPHPSISDSESTARIKGQQGMKEAYQVVSCALDGQQSKCALWCTCACHSPQKHLSLPTKFERLVGQLLIGCSVHSWLRPRCNLTKCKRSSETRVRLRYKFPAWWFLGYCVTLQAQARDLGVVLRFPQVRPCNAAVFEMVVHGRLDLMKAAFSSREASIYDTEDTGGHTLLHRALITKNVEVIEFLLKQGADILVANQKRNSSADLFWRSVLSNNLPGYKRLASHFTDTTFIEDGGFTIIHKIIFGQSKSDLNQVLTDLPHLVNHQDAYGQAPLHWAAARGDVESISTLLNHNAEVDIKERGGSTPLLWGISSGNPLVTKRLLEGGANPNHASNIWLDRAIHVACHTEMSHRHIPILLEHGGDASASSRLRDSPLEFAASRNFPLTIEALYRATPRSKHTKAVVAAIKSNALKSLHKLLELNADCLGIDTSGKTVLHYAAAHGLEPTIELLLLHKYILPPNTADDSGRFPVDYISERSPDEVSRVAIRSLFEPEEKKAADMAELRCKEVIEEDDDESELETAASVPSTGRKILTAKLLWLVAASLLWFKRACFQWGHYHLGRAS